MKLFASVFFAILLPFSISQAQDGDNLNPLQKGSKALQFQISNNFTLDSFSGSTFSYKRQLSDTQANRIGVSLNNSYDLTDNPNDDRVEEISNLDLNIGIEYTWMNYTNPESEIKFFYGYGPGIDFGFDKFIREETENKRTQKETFYGVAALGYAGVEWFFQNSMSLHAEYRGSIQINYIQTEELNEFEIDEIEEVKRSHTTRFRLGGNGVRFGISVYF